MDFLKLWAVRAITWLVAVATAAGLVTGYLLLDPEDSDRVLGLLEAVDWPLAVIVSVMVLARPLRALLTALARKAADPRQRVSASTPFGSIVFGPEAVEAADEAALRDLLKGAGSEEERAELESALRSSEELRRLRSEVDDVWGADALGTSEARARRIAERARVLLHGMTADQKVDELKFSEYDFIDDDQPVFIRSLGSAPPSAPSKALLLVASRSDWSAGLNDATFLEFVRAAELLSESGVEDVVLPPFEGYHLSWARKANGYHWE